MPPLLSLLPFTPGRVILLLGLAALVATNRRAGRVAWHLPAWEHAFGLLGLSWFADGCWLGLVDTPRERMMGEVVRVLYVHVPSAWGTLVVFMFAVIFAFGSLWTGRRGFDLAMEACVEVGVVLCGLLLATGSIFARPTWGVWWTWDPRLTSSAVMMLAFVGVLLLRQAVSDPGQRAVWSAVASILSATSMALTYWSVQLWRSVHQMQSNPGTIDPFMTTVMRMNAFAVLFMATWLVARRYRIALARSDEEQPPELPPAPQGVAA